MRSSASSGPWAHTDGSIPRRSWLLLSFGFLILGGGAWLLEGRAEPEDWWMHGAWCVLGLALAAPMLWHTLGQGFSTILVDHRVMFLAAFAAYFLFGAALLSFGPEIEVEQTLRYYPIDAGQALRVDALNAFGFGVALLMATAASGRWLAKRADRLAAGAARIPPRVVIVVFLVIGTVASAYTLSFDLGFQEGFVPGLVRMAGSLSLVAIFLAAATTTRQERALRLFAVALALILAISGALQFGKLATLLPLAALTGGLALRYGSRVILPAGFAVALGVYLTMGDVASYGRAAIAGGGGIGFEERLPILVDGWSDTSDLAEEEQYSPWARLCYTPSQAAAFDFWDSGQGGDTFSLIPWLFVPRMLAPDKPEITITGGEFHQKITGHEGSSTGMGIFASGYYAGGWWGMFAASLLCGWILAQMSAIARVVVKTESVLMLPFALQGGFMAFRIDGNFVSDYLGAFVFILYPVLGLPLLLASGGDARR